MDIAKTDNLSLFGFNRDSSQPQLSSGLIATYGYLDWQPDPGGHIGNIADRTCALLIEQFRVDRPRINALVRSVAQLCQDVENVLYDLIRYRAINLAVGKQLDRIGEIVGLSRTSTDDDAYRSDLYFQIFLNTSGGEPETLISALQRATGAARVDYCEPTPARVVLTANETTKPIQPNLLIRMQSLAAAGVKVDVQINNAANSFIFNGDVLDAIDEPPYYSCINDPYFSGLGFGELMPDESVEGGGAFTELII